jgi:hypothetical protein
MFDCTTIENKPLSKFENRIAANCHQNIAKIIRRRDFHGLDDERPSEVHSLMDKRDKHYRPEANGIGVFKQHHKVAFENSLQNRDRTLMDVVFSKVTQ